MKRVAGEALAYAVFLLAVAALSAWPEYRILADTEGMISLSFTHAAERVGACRRLSPEELASLPPNMRKPEECPRERHPVQVRLVVDGQLLHAETAPPSGLWNDGKASVYRRLPVAAGRHEIYVSMSDTGDPLSRAYELRKTVVLAPGQNLVVSFDDLARTFVIE